MSYSKHIRIFVFALGLVGLCAFWVDSMEARPSSSAPVIRVAVLEDVSGLSLSVKSRYTLSDAKTGEKLLKGRSMQSRKVIPTPSGIQIGKTEYPTSRILIVPKREADVYINGRRFRGEMRLIKETGGKLLAVNAVDLEDYIKGVLYHEVSHRWPLEAIKAQAVAARTYALYRMSKNKSRDYDVTSDVYSQVYGGRTSEKYRTNIAVNRTRGLILIYQGKILPAYYHATCGGHTEDVSNLWKEEDLPPLKGVVCPFCRKSPHYSWRKNFQLKEIQEKLNAHGYNLWLIKNISVVDRNESGRIHNLLIETRDGKKVTISGKDFRNIIGPNEIKSNNYKIVMKGYYMDLIGKGWGHGVGLCQWGANFMARERYSFDEILSYYYPHAQIVRYETAGF